MDAIQFIFAGNATFTISSNRTNQELTYQVIWRKAFHSYLVKSFNTRTGGVWNIGYYNKKYISWRSTSDSNVFAWFIEHLIKGTMPDYIEVRHLGRCGRCGKALKDEESLANGFGADCLKLIDTESLFKSLQS